MLYAWTDLFFSNTSSSCYYALLARFRYLELIYFPVHYLHQPLLSHPLDRPLLSVVVLTLFLVVYLLALIYGLMSILRMRFYKLQLKTKNYYSRIKVGLNLKPYIHQGDIFRNYKSRIFHSVHVKD